MKDFSVRVVVLGRRVRVLVGVMLLLVGCTIEGGRTPTPAALQLAPVVGEDATPAVTKVRDSTWAIGLLDEPTSLLPNQSSAAAQRLSAPLVELLFPSPILAFHYGYTSTGVLEQIPTLENGGIERRRVQVYLDATGTITTTATDVVTDVDQLVITFRWNPKLRWSDGEGVTAEDSVFAYEVAKAAPEGAEMRDRLSQVVSYTAVDAHTTQAVLQPDMVSLTAFLNCWTPLPYHILKGVALDSLATSDFAYQPMGYGPYAIERRSAGEVRMVRNAYYFGAVPEAEFAVVSFLSSVDLLRDGVAQGTLDAGFTDRVPPEQFPFLDQAASDRLIQVQYVPNPIWMHIDFNLDVPLLQKIQVRRAIALGTDRATMAQVLFGGHTPVLSSWVLPEQHEAAPPDQVMPYDYNPDEARRLLDEAGYRVQPDTGLRAGADGVTMTLQLMTIENNSALREVARRFAQDMRALGVTVSVQSMAADALFDQDGPLFQRQFELALFAWIAGPDPGGLPLWSCAAVPSQLNDWSGDNFAGWCFRDADRAIRVAVATLDRDERQASYVLHQRLWSQELPVVPLFQRLSVVLTAPGVQGVQPDALAPLSWNIAMWRRVRS